MHAYVMCRGSSLAPRGASGLKLDEASVLRSFGRSRPARGEWIEMLCHLASSVPSSRLAPRGASGLKCSCHLPRVWHQPRLAPRGASGLKWFRAGLGPFLGRLAPRGASGLKSSPARQGLRGTSSRPARGEWIEMFRPGKRMLMRIGLAPRGASGLK